MSAPTNKPSSPPKESKEDPKNGLDFLMLPEKEQRYIAQIEALRMENAVLKEEMQTSEKRVQELEESLQKIQKMVLDSFSEEELYQMKYRMKKYGDLKDMPVKKNFDVEVAPKKDILGNMNPSMKVWDFLRNDYPSKKESKNFNLKEHISDKQLKDGKYYINKEAWRNGDKPLF